MDGEQGCRNRRTWFSRPAFSASTSIAFWRPSLGAPVRHKAFVEPGDLNNSQLALFTVVYAVILYQASSASRGVRSGGGGGGSPHGQCWPSSRVRGSCEGPAKDARCRTVCRHVDLRAALGTLQYRRSWRPTSARPTRAGRRAGPGAVVRDRALFPVIGVRSALASQCRLGGGGGVVLRSGKRVLP